MSTLLKRICSIIDELPPDLDFEVLQESGASGLSQGLESHHLSDRISHDAASLSKQIVNHAGLVREILPQILRCLRELRVENSKS